MSPGTSQEEVSVSIRHPRHHRDKQKDQLIGTISPVAWDRFFVRRQSKHPDLRLPSSFSTPEAVQAVRYILAWVAEQDDVPEVPPLPCPDSFERALWLHQVSKFMGTPLELRELVRRGILTHLTITPRRFVSVSDFHLLVDIERTPVQQHFLKGAVRNIIDSRQCYAVSVEGRRNWCEIVDRGLQKKMAAFVALQAYSVVQQLALIVDPKMLSSRLRAKSVGDKACRDTASAEEQVHSQRRWNEAWLGARLPRPVG